MKIEDIRAAVVAADDAKTWNDSVELVYSATREYLSNAHPESFVEEAEPTEAQRAACEALSAGLGILVDGSGDWEDDDGARACLGYEVARALLR